MTLVSTGKLDPVSVIVPPVALVVKAYRAWRGCGPELSHQATTWLSAAYFVFFPADLWVFSRALAVHAPNPALYAALLAAIHLMLFAMVLRLASASTTRDYLFLALLAFAMMLGAAILTVDTTFLILFLIFLVLAVSTFVGLEMRRSAAGSSTPALEFGTPAARRLHRALGLTSASVALSALVIGAGIFFLLPRFTAGYLPGLHLQPSLISGFTDDVELGQIGRIKKNPAVVMRVRPEGDPQRLPNLRWRGIALTRFDGRRWSTEEHEQKAVLPAADGWFLLGAPPVSMRLNSNALGYTVLLEPVASDALFVAAQADRVRGRFGREAGPRRSYLLLDKTGSLSNPFHNFERLRYEALSYLPRVAPEQLRAASTDYPRELRQVYLQLPDLDPRIPALAQQVASRSPTAYDKTRAIEMYLRTHYGYTLDLSGSPAEHPLAHFLFERRAGHCEYFAAAMTVMLRTQGIPARYVNGFLPGEYNELGQDFIVRARDAHSWVEVYFPDVGWIPFDPTPPADAAPLGLLGRLALYWDWFELTWSEWVVNYDFAHQMTLAHNLQRLSHSWTERVRTGLERAHRRILERLKEWQARALHAPHALGGALGAVLLALLLRNRASRQALSNFCLLCSGSLPKSHPRAATLRYELMLRLLARRGLKKPPGQTPREFAASLPATELTEPVGQLTELYQNARYGGRPLEEQAMSELLLSVKSLLRITAPPA
ncbi:MAG TPA: DUF3488 and transglutaminase-like domain-containing protein [Candidatus Acidoferrales bacterium]|nr:DUF3488 and transglutaminase-like domain-containing protein [Candidatus Acidoferrales bacterium]